MKRGLFFLSSGALLLVAIGPIVVHAASLGPIVSDACYCNGTSAPGWGCILGTFQNAINFLVGFATVIITLFIAWAGFTYMTSGGSPEQRSLANRRILNAVIGLVIALASYLLVNSLLNVLYNPNAGFGSWNSILGGIPAEDCLAVHNPPNGLPALNNSANGSGGSATAPPATVPATTNANAAAAASYADSHALPKYTGKCALYVRQALAAGGLTSFNNSHPEFAYEYNPYLQSAGFTSVSQSGYSPQVGDVIVFQPISGHPSGHIEMFDGSNWVSDTVQNGEFAAASGYSSDTYNIWRWPGS